MGYPKGRPRSPESVAKMRATLLAKYASDPGFRARNAAQLRRVNRDPKAQAKKGRTMAKLAAAGGLAAFHAASRSDETQAKRTAGIQRASQDPAVRQRKSAAMRAHMKAHPRAWARSMKKAQTASHTQENEEARVAAARASGGMARTIAAMSASMARPDVRAKLSAERKIRFNTDAGRATMRAVSLAGHTAAVRDRRRAASRAYATTVEGRDTKSRAGVAAVRALKGASARRAHEYNGYLFRSSWEVAFARFLDGLGTAWEYEPETFKLSDGSRYTPDFRVHLPSGSLFVEVKSMRRAVQRGEGGLTKWRLFCQNYPCMLLSENEIAAILVR